MLMEKIRFKYIIRPLVIVLAVMVIMYIAFVVLCMSGIGHTLGPEVSKAGLLGVRPGMTQKELIKRLGLPIYEYRSLLLGDYSDSHAPKLTTLIYAEPWFCGGLEVSVGLKQGIVVSVGAEWFDLGLFSCVEDGCTFYPYYKQAKDALNILDSCLICRRHTYIGG